jgi:hypothetical protein
MEFEAVKAGIFRIPSNTYTRMLGEKNAEPY